jgi:2-polyprenyl-6-methoxyphenol hydroxylase-like FAD-dependent oxidoreductase
MSPIGGVGINLAIQDAIAAANLLTVPLRNGRVGERELRAVQRRRQWPARVTQAVQVFIQSRVIGRVLTEGRSPFLSRVASFAKHLPFLPRVPAYLVGVGFRPEHARRIDAPSQT